MLNYQSINEDDLGSVTPQQVDNPAALPRVQVQDQQGNIVRWVDLPLSGLRVGSQVGSDGLQLDDPAVGRNHLRIGWDGIQATVTDLGSRTGTSLEGTPLVPQIPQPWGWWQKLAVGPFTLCLEQPLSTFEQTTPTSDRIGVSIDASARALNLYLEVNQVVHVTVENLGERSDEFTVTVEGIPTEWVAPPSQKVLVSAKGNATVGLNITVPRTPESRAQEYVVTVRATSSLDPTESGTAQARWRVPPFTASALEIRPKRRRGSRGAAYTVFVRNEGNAPNQYKLNGIAENQSLEFEFAQAHISVDPGITLPVRITVESRNQLVGDPQTHSFTVQATPVEGLVVADTAEFVQQVPLPRWVPWIAALLLLLLLCVSGAFLGPLVAKQIASGPTSVPSTLSTTVALGATTDVTSVVEAMTDKLATQYAATAIISSGSATAAIATSLASNQASEMTAIAVQTNAAQTSATQTPGLSSAEERGTEIAQIASILKGDSGSQTQPNNPSDTTPDQNETNEPNEPKGPDSDATAAAAASSQAEIPAPTDTPTATPKNNPPQIDAASPQLANQNENSPIAVDVSDPDGGNTIFHIILTANTGTLTMSGKTGTSVDFTGDQGDITVALGTLSYQSATNSTSSDNIRVVLEDNGIDGFGTHLKDAKTIIVNINLNTPTPTSTLVPTSVTGPTATASDTPTATATATSIPAPATISVSFSTSSVTQNDIAQIQFLVSNQTQNVDITRIGFLVDLSGSSGASTGLEVEDNFVVENSCLATITSSSDTNINVSGLDLNANSICSIKIKVQATKAGDNKSISINSITTTKATVHTPLPSINVKGPKNIDILNNGSPQQTAIGTNFSTHLSVKVTDEDSKPIKNISVTFKVQSPSSQASATFGSKNQNNQNTDDQGIANAPDITANQNAGGPYIVTASVDEDTSVTTNFSLTNTPGLPKNIILSSNPAQNKVGTVWTEIKATVTDAGNNPLSGITVAFNITATSDGASAVFSNTLTTATYRTSQDGSVVLRDLKSNCTPSSRNYTLSASVQSSVNGTPTPIMKDLSLKNIIGDPTHILPVAGNNQSVVIGGNLLTGGSNPDIPFTVIVLDNCMNPIKDKDVTFSVPLSGASGTFTNSPTAGKKTFPAKTNTFGVAKVTSSNNGSFFKANTDSATYDITASISSPNISTSLSITNAEKIVGDKQSAVAGQNFYRALQMTSNSDIRFTTNPDSCSRFNGSNPPRTVSPSNNIIRIPLRAGSINNNIIKETCTFTATSSIQPISSTLFIYNPNEISITSGSSTSDLASPIRVRGFSMSPGTVTIQDSTQAPITGMRVVLTIAPGDVNGPDKPNGTFFNNSTSVDVITDSNGTISIPPIIANAISGIYSINVTIPGSSIQSQFFLNNVPDAGV